MSEFRIDPRARTGLVSLTVSDLERAVRFYEVAIGLRVQGRSGGAARLGAGGEELLELVGRPEARRARGTAGLYHFAILVPSRLELARAIRRLAAAGWRLDGASDHGVSEALYLSDPDGNGIEIYRDRPRAEWPVRDGGLAMVTEAMDLQGVVALLDADTAEPAPTPADTVVGHVHLHVGNLAAAEAFYRGGLGLELMQRYGRMAAFLSAGGYHHHLGVNTWAGEGAPPQPEGAIGLRYWTLLLPDGAALGALVEQARGAGVELTEGPDGLLARDPAGNRVLLRLGA